MKDCFAKEPVFLKYAFFEAEHPKLLAVVSDDDIIFPVLSTFSVQTYPPISEFSILATKLESNMPSATLAKAINPEEWL